MRFAPPHVHPVYIWVCGGCKSESWAGGVRGGWGWVRQGGKEGARVSAATNCQQEGPKVTTFLSHVKWLAHACNLPQFGWVLPSLPSLQRLEFLSLSAPPANVLAPCSAAVDCRPDLQLHHSSINHLLQLVGICCFSWCHHWKHHHSLHPWIYLLACSALGWVCARGRVSSDLRGTDDDLSHA